MPLDNLKNKFNNVLWETELEKLLEWQRLIIKLLRIFQAVIRDLSDGLPTLRAMSLVYTTLLSIVPLLAVAFSVLKGFGLHNQIEPLLIQMLSPLGDKGINIAHQIVEFVDDIDVGLLGVMGIIFLFYTVITLIHKIERAFNHTWHITEYRGLAQRISDYLSVIMVGPILIFTALAITAAITSSSLISTLSDIEPFGFIFKTTASLLPYVLVIVAFCVIYLLVPNTQVKWGSAFTGAFIGGVLWESTGWLFATFIANSSNYTVVYSGFAIMVIFMIWLYLSWLILLIGASIAYYHQHPEKIPADQNLSDLSNHMKEKIALLSMYHIGKNFHENKIAWTSSDLSDVLNISSESLTDVLHALECDKLITRHQGREVSYLPAQSLENIFVFRILESIRHHNKINCIDNDLIHSEKSVDDLMKTVDSSIKNKVQQLSLRELITSHALDM